MRIRRPAGRKAPSRPDTATGSGRVAASTSEPRLEHGSGVPRMAETPVLAEHEGSQYCRNIS